MLLQQRHTPRNVIAAVIMLDVATVEPAVRIAVAGVAEY